MNPETIKEIIGILVCTIIILVVFYFAQSPRKKQEKELKKIQDNLKKGDKIITYSGLAGKIEEVLEDRVIVSTYPDNVNISVEKWAIAGIDDRNIE